jgi:DNA-binding CsgD family transcriptional regulator
VWQLKEQGLSNSQIAQRLGVTPGAIYHVLRKKDSRNKENLALA